MKQNHLLTSLIVLMALSQMEVHSQTPKAMPRLVVSILVDQLATDYMEAFMPLYGEDGFKLLLEKGRVYQHATYPTKQPDCAVSAAVFATGASAFDHGIVAREWWDRQTLRVVNAVDDATQQGINTPQGASAVRLQVSTFSDELKKSTEGKALVYAIAPSKETAILTAGHSADAALWIDDATGQWASTKYYGSLPQWVKSATGEALPKVGASQVWTPVDAIVGRFNYLGGGGTKQAFKHKFEGVNLYKDYKTSALVNENVTEMVRQCLSYTAIGRDEVADYLSVTLNARTYRNAGVEQVGMELQDTYVRLDAAISKLLHHIDKHIGINNTLLVLTSTGEQNRNNSGDSKYRIPTGTVDVSRMGHLLNVYLMALYGNGQYVESVFGREIYLNHKLIEQKNIARQEIVKKSEEFLLSFSGVKAVYNLYELSFNRTKALNEQAYNPIASGDLRIVLRAGWSLVNDTHSNEYYANEATLPFPVIFYGANIASEQIDDEVQVEAVAPTLSKALRIRAPNSCSTKALKGL